MKTRNFLPLTILSIILVMLSSSCDHKITSPDDKADLQNFSMRIGGALEAELDSDIVLSNEQVSISTHGGERVLSMFFQTKTSRDNQEEEAQVRIIVPFHTEQGFPEVGVINFKTEDFSNFNSMVGYRLIRHDDSALQSVFDFRVTTGQLRVSESSETHLKGDLLVSAKQVRGIRKSFGQTEEVQLANDGQIAVIVQLDVAVNR